MDQVAERLRDRIRGEFAAWRRRARTRLALSAVDPRLLADIGLTETERRRECAKWFWGR